MRFFFRVQQKRFRVVLSVPHTLIRTLYEIYLLGIEPEKKNGNPGLSERKPGLSERDFFLSYIFLKVRVLLIRDLAAPLFLQAQRQSIERV